MNVENGSVVERHADGSELRCQGCRKPAGELNVSASAKDGHRRPFGEGRLQSRNPPALLVDTHPERQARRSPCTSTDISATCSGASMLRANRITPPSENSFASERISGVIVVPGRLPIRS